MVRRHEVDGLGVGVVVHGVEDVVVPVWKFVSELIGGLGAWG